MLEDMYLIVILWAASYFIRHSIINLKLEFIIIKSNYLKINHHQSHNSHHSISKYT
jgi:uncharacterized protein YxeA